MPVMSIRLSTNELRRIRRVAKLRSKEKSSVARELMNDGLKYQMLLSYKDGKSSVSELSKTLELTVSETIDFLSKFGIESPISYDDYLQGIETAKDAF